ncbi:MAG TPA: hypothetical protein VMM35_10820, partial [Longimicrobiales bacterium]|nr:hypothetical protein [Longimicrobiales bacterium]
MSQPGAPSPLRILRRILAWLLPSGRVRDGLLGDLDELYAERARKGRLPADLWYVRQVLSAGMHYAARGRGSGSASDIALAARTLLRTPSFTAAAVGTLALGIGANAAVFGLVDEVLLRPPPYERPHELVLVWATLGPSADAM